MANSSFSVSPSKYFKNYEWKARQDFVDSLVIGAIRQNGMNVKYIPKENFVRDELFGDDTYTKYEKAITIEGYAKNVDSFGGSGDIFTIHGFDISDEITFTISKTRWLQVQEDAFLPAGETAPRQNPKAGDLLFFPLFNKMFEINHVEQESVFWQFGKNYVFDLACELYKYNQDDFATGFEGIDQVSEDYSRDLANTEVLGEDGGVLVSEDGDPIIGENYRLEDHDAVANNELIENNANTDLINYGEKSPFTGYKW